MVGESVTGFEQHFQCADVTTTVDGGQLEVVRRRESVVWSGLGFLLFCSLSAGLAPEVALDLAGVGQRHHCKKHPFEKVPDSVSLVRVAYAHSGYYNAHNGHTETRTAGATPRASPAIAMTMPIVTACYASGSSRAPGSSCNGWHHWGTR